MSLLPPNIAVKLVEDLLPWDRSTQFHIDAFLQAYTLHDSHWITLHVNCGWEDTVVAAICFDPVWNQSVSKPTSHCADWPLLFLRFTCVSDIQLGGFSNIYGLQRGIANVSVKHLSEEEVITKILDHYSASVQIQHFALVDALVISPSEEVIELSSHVA